MSTKRNATSGARHFGNDPSVREGHLADGRNRAGTAPRRDAPPLAIAWLARPRRQRVGRSVILGSAILAGGLIGAPGAASAAGAPKVVPVVDATPGVVLADGGRAVVLKSRLLRASRRGRALEVSCFPAVTAPGAVQSESGMGTALSKSIRRVGVPRDGDWCVVSITIKQTDGQTTKPIAALYRNAAGLEALYEHSVAPIMGLAAGLALGDLSGERVDAGRVVGALQGLRVLGRLLSPVAIPQAGAPVGFGQLGVWADGPRVSVTARTPGGRALYLSYDTSDRAIATNVYDALNDETLGTTTTTSGDR